MHVVRHGYGGLTGQLRPGKSIPDIPSTAALPDTHRPIRPMSGISDRAVIMQLRRSGTESSLTLRWRETDSNLYGAFPVKSCFLFCWRFLVRSGKAVLRPVACDQVRGARGRGQGTETLAELSGLPLSRACVSQRPLFKPGAGFDA